MNTTLAKQMTREKGTANSYSINVEDVVKTAAHVIAPYGPIDKFAAINPWNGMEDEPIEQAARKLKAIVGLDIFPNGSLIKKAWEQKKIKKEYVMDKLEHWMKANVKELSIETAKDYCSEALLDFESNNDWKITSEIKTVAEKLNRYHLEPAELKFEKTYSQLLEEQGIFPASSRLNRLMIKWCKLYLDRSQGVWSMPYKEKGFYFAWKTSGKYDPELKPYRDDLSQLPEDSSRALEDILQKLGISFSNIQSYLEAHLLCLPGWAGMMLWRSENIKNENNLLLEYLVVRLIMEWLLTKEHLPLTQRKTNTMEKLIKAWEVWGELPVQSWSRLSFSEIRGRLLLAYRFDSITRNKIWLEAWEKTYEEQLQKTIKSHLKSVSQSKFPSAQFAFCIDVRSEPFRRQLEKAGPFETIGTAGFFGLPIETCELGSHHSHPSLPVMFKPLYKIREIAAGSELKNFVERQHAAGSFAQTLKHMKQQLMMSMLLPEISGPWLGMQTLARSFFPRHIGNAMRKLSKRWHRKPATQLTLDRRTNSAESLPIGFTDEEKIRFAGQALKMMGLTDRFAPLVVICGHASISTNNPYAASLDCGACGGASSAMNARVLVQLCNQSEVREALRKEGINIPDQTVFVAAEHITSLDELRWLDMPKLDGEAKKAFEQIEAVLPTVSSRASAERLKQLPRIRKKLEDPSAESSRIAVDWSEIRPEWGLARNASFIIGKRSLTELCNLEGRSFLHNYDWQKDPDGAILNRIISGPATVAQWINLQYYASTVAPHYYGSGNKTTQSVTAGIGVMQGNASDLLTGLPWQSVMESDETYYHEPLRLLIVIQAPKKFIERLIMQNQKFHQKLANGWVRLASIDPEGNWISWS